MNKLGINYILRYIQTRFTVLLIK